MVTTFGWGEIVNRYLLVSTLLRRGDKMNCVGKIYLTSLKVKAVKIACKIVYRQDEGNRLRSACHLKNVHACQVYISREYAFFQRFIIVKKAFETIFNNIIFRIH